MYISMTSTHINFHFLLSIIMCDPLVNTMRNKEQEYNGGSLTLINDSLPLVPYNFVSIFN
jgi:hypothetical protein